MSKQASAALTAPVITEQEGAALTALLTYGVALPGDVVPDVGSAAAVALVNVAAARDTLAEAVTRGRAVVGIPRWGMAVAVYAAIEAGATRQAISETGGVNRSIVGQYARFPHRLAVVADATGVERKDAPKDAALIEAVWSYASRLNESAFTSLVEAVEGLAANDDAGTVPADLVSLAAEDMGARRGSRTDATEDTDTDADATENGLTSRETAVRDAVALILAVHTSDDATDAERADIAAMVATLSA